MAPNALHLPLVVQLIAESLSFKDLANCVLASRTWHRAFTSFLYEDVITFRSKSVEGDLKQPSCSYFSNTASRLGLIKHGHHICALTCRSDQLLTILDTATCVNLIEVNVVMEPLPPNDTASLAKLTELMVQNTNLQAVSIENINFCSVNLLQKLSEFVDHLGRFPSITCVYLDGYFQSTHNRTEVWRSMGTIATKLLERIKQDNHQIKNLSLQRPDLLTRSKRGPSLGKAWIARESPILGAESRGLARASGGRWEIERRLQGYDGSRPTIAVVETESELRLVVPEEIYRTLVPDFLQRYPNCTAVALPGPKRDQIQQYVSQCSRLNSVDVRQIYDPLDLSSILIPGNGLSSLCVESPHCSSAIFSQPIQPTTTESLVSLVLDTSGISMNNLFSILATATMLQEIQIQAVYIDGTEPSEISLWASADLRKVVLGLYLTGHRPDRHQDMNDDRTRWRDEPTGSAERSTGAAARFGSLFLDQLNAQHELKELELSFNHRLFPRFSPLLDLSLDPAKGLPRLCNLGRLEKFVIHGLAHHLGRAEIEWMREYWPLLFSIQVPLIHCWLGEDDAITSCRNMYRGGIPKYQEWFSQLKVAIPAECYRCDWDHHVNSVWRGDYRLGTGQHCGCQRIQDGMSGEITWDGPDALRSEAEYEDRQEWLAEEDALSDEVDQYDGLYMGWHFKRRPQDHTKYARKYR
ncbi:MAG: hypothetical protein BYD32DRAFT_411466 [Podila humilis]|nr:MAG: hypothetical protein BYD32DRAFT_411466 [Podila humilis]